MADARTAGGARTATWQAGSTHEPGTDVRAFTSRDDLSPQQQQLHLVRGLVTSATGGWLQPGDDNHSVSVDFIVDNLAQPGSLPPTEAAVRRVYNG